jgi:hypothetical protein
MEGVKEVSRTLWERGKIMTLLRASEIIMGIG